MEATSSDNNVDFREIDNNYSTRKEFDDKRAYLLNQIQSLIDELTNKTSNILNKTFESNRVNSNNNNKLLNIIEQKLGETSTSNHNSSIDPQSLGDYRMHTILCSNCYGDLLIV
jgi:hypothetical protein